MTSVSSNFSSPSAMPKRAKTVMRIAACGPSLLRMASVSACAFAVSHSITARPARPCETNTNATRRLVTASGDESELMGFSGYRVAPSLERRDDDAVFALVFRRNGGVVAADHRARDLARLVELDAMRDDTFVQHDAFADPAV